MNYLYYYEIICFGQLIATFEDKKDAIDYCKDNCIDKKFIIKKK